MNKIKRFPVQNNFSVNFCRSSDINNHEKVSFILRLHATICMQNKKPTHNLFLKKESSVVETLSSV